MENLRHFSLFSGIESFKKALTNLGIDNELVGYSEFDKYASVALAAIHGVSEQLNYGDITKIDEKTVPDCDLITYGFPCQDISIAGHQKGIAEGETRSGLLYDALRIIKYKKPKYAIAENVKNLVGKKFIDDFNSLLEELDGYGYNNYWQVLNAKDYGIPQNRERVFIVSIRKDVDDGKFEFPKPYDSGLRLKDLLEVEVEDKYYIDNERTSILLNNLKDKEMLPGGINVSKQGKVFDGSTEVASCLLARDYKGLGNQSMTAVAESIIVASRGRNPDNPSDRTVGSPTEQRLEPNSQGIANTLTTVQKDNLVLEPNELKLHTNLSGGKWDKIHESARRVYNEEGIAPTIPTCGGGNIEPKVAVREATKLGYAIATVGDSINLEQPNSKTRRGRVGKEVAQTLTTSCNQAVLESVDVRHTELPCIFDDRDKGFGVKTSDVCPTQRAERSGIKCIQSDYKIRKLTPLECWRLMGFTDEDYRKARQALEDRFYNGKDRSNSQMYKMAGNSIVVDVLEGILKNLIK